MTAALELALKSAEQWPWTLKALKKIATKGDAPHFVDVLRTLDEQVREHRSAIESNCDALTEVANRIGSTVRIRDLPFPNASVAALGLSERLLDTIFLPSVWRSVEGSLNGACPFDPELAGSPAHWPTCRAAVASLFVGGSSDDVTLTILSADIERERVALFPPKSVLTGGGRTEAEGNERKPVEPQAETLAGGDDAGGGRGKAVGDETNRGTDTPPNNEAHPYRFECKPEIVHVHGFGESVDLEKTEGVERLIAIVTRRRVNVMELVRIGAPQQGRDRSSVDVDADRLSERESVNDERFESRLGDDAPSAVLEAVRELIEQRDAASARGDDQGAGELTAQINAAIQDGKTAVQKAAGAVRKTFDRTYDRLREGDHGIALAKHFDQFVKRPRGESDYVYAPDETEGKIVWSVK